MTTDPETPPKNIVYYSIGVDSPITPDQSLPELPAIPRGSLVVIEGRAPIWRYGVAFTNCTGRRPPPLLSSIRG